MPLNEQKPQSLEARLERALDRLERMILPEVVYTVEEAAGLLNTSKMQVYAYIRSGKLAAFHLERNGQKLLTTGRDIENLINLLKRESA